MQFGYVILYVGDVRKTLEFYQQAFGFERKMLHESGSYGEVETGGTTLAFADFALQEAQGKTPRPASAAAPSFELAFTTQDLPRALERALAAGAALISAPSQMPWGQTIAYVSDINGFLLELCTPVQP